MITVEEMEKVKGILKPSNGVSNEIVPEALKQYCQWWTKAQTSPKLGRNITIAILPNF